MSEQRVRIRDREPADLELCVQALATVHRRSGYPTNWPADPARWLTPPGILRAWIGATDEEPVAGHVVLRKSAASAPAKCAAEVSRLFVLPAARRQGIGLALLHQAIEWATTNRLDLVLEVTDQLRAARTLYQQTGFRLIGTRRADWTAPGGQPVTLLRYGRARGGLL